MTCAEEVVEYLENIADIYGEMTVNQFIEHLQEKIELMGE